MKTWNEDQQEAKYTLLNEVMGLKPLDEQEGAYKRSILRKTDPTSLQFYPRSSQLLVFRKNLKLKTIGDYTVLVSRDRDHDTYGVLVKKIDFLVGDDWSSDPDDIEPFLELEVPGIYASGIEDKEEVPEQVRRLIRKL